MSSGVPITGNTVITVRDQLNAAWRAAPRLHALVLGLFPAVVLLGPLITGDVQASSIPTWLMISGALIALWAAILGGFFFGITAFTHSRLSDEQKRISYEIGPERIVVRDGAGSEVSFAWSAVRRIVESGEGFALALRPFGSRWLPKRAFTPAALVELRLLAKEKLEPAARVAL